MANFVLDKGFLVQGTAAAVANRFVGFGTVNWSITLTPTLNGAAVGVLLENVDAAKVTTGKVIANVRLLGIAPVKASGVITRGGPVGTTATGLAIAAASGQVLGVALESAVDGDIIDVLLTQSGVF